MFFFQVVCSVLIWFNPPISKNVQTNIGREFLNLIENCFPLNHKLRTLFNKNNLKLSYSCSPNIKQIIDGHNKTILRQNTPPTTRETYIGLYDTTFKLRYRNHICSFRNEWYRNATELSKHVWNLKDENIKFDIKWRKVKQARSYSNITKKCNLRLWEKYFITCKPEMSTLNNRNELTSCCRHSRKFLLKNVIT